jgi:hypothetical protein
MRKRIKIIKFLLWTAIGFLLIPGIVHSEIDWTIVKQIDLNAAPVDVATSGDGKLLFVLTHNEIAVYASDNNEIVSRIPVDREFDRINYFRENNLLVLTSNTSKTVRIIRIDKIYDIDTSGLPFRGPADAPVTIAVFDDYQ